METLPRINRLASLVVTSTLRCNGCLKEVPLDQFYLRIHSKCTSLSYSSYCKPCFIQRGRRYFKRARELVRQHYGPNCQCCGESITAIAQLEHTARVRIKWKGNKFAQGFRFARICWRVYAWCTEVLRDLRPYGDDRLRCSHGSAEYAGGPCLCRQGVVA